jgi:hypothetical protein
VRILSAQGDVMRPEDLTATAAVTTSLDFSKLVARTDSFTVLVQGNPLGFMRTRSRRRRRASATWSARSSAPSSIRQRADVQRQRA